MYAIEEKQKMSTWNLLLPETFPAFVVPLALEFHILSQQG